MTSATRPRWEWRTFGQSFGTAEETFGALPPERVEESNEVYLLSKALGENVKVRDGLLDVKHLEQVNADGLEQWLPVMKASFPLAATDVASVLRRLAISAAPLARDAYTLDELLAEFVYPSRELSATHVHKRRRHYTIGGCMAELTDLRTDAEETRTVAVESEDADRVIATVRDLDLASFANTSFPRWLEALTLGPR